MESERERKERERSKWKEETLATKIQTEKERHTKKIRNSEKNTFINKQKVCGTFPPNLEYFLPSSVSAIDRMYNVQFPALVYFDYISLYRFLPKDSLCPSNVRFQNSFFVVG